MLSPFITRATVPAHPQDSQLSVAPCYLPVRHHTHSKQQPSPKHLSVQEFMIKNKAEVAYELLDKKGEELTVPDYIKLAIEWIRE